MGRMRRRRGNPDGCGVGMTSWLDRLGRRHGKPDGSDADAGMRMGNLKSFNCNAMFWRAAAIAAALVLSFSLAMGSGVALEGTLPVSGGAVAATSSVDGPPAMASSPVGADAVAEGVDVFVGGVADEVDSRFVLLNPGGSGGSGTVPTIAQADEQERDIVLVLDISGSMSGTPISALRQAAANFVGQTMQLAHIRSSI
jgi:hypothetical protein